MSIISRKKEIEKGLNIFMMFIALLAILSLIGKGGFAEKWRPFFGGVDVFIIVCFVGNSILKLIISHNWWRYIKEHPFQYILIALFISQVLIVQLILTDAGYRYILNQLSLVSLTKIYIVLMQFYILLELLAEIGRLNARMASLPLPPATIFVASFIILILGGAFLLLLPGATKGKSIKIIDAIFTSTSATCVTGLIVVPTGGFFTRFGQTIILVLIQFGGLGLMTFATFFALVFRSEFGLRERMLLGDVLNVQVFGRIKSLLGAIVGITVGTEAIGTVLLYIFSGQYQDAIHSRFFWSLFHSVSAFCNAGFSIWDNNIILFTSDWKMTLVFATLIILGGLGFVVLADIGRYIFSSFKSKKRRVPHFRLQTKIVITTTFILIGLGMIFLMLGDKNNLMRQHSFGVNLLTAFFQSVTARTAGFNTIAIGSLAPGALFIIIVLMFIGASPGSTGGGIKTTTIAVVFGAIKSKLMGNDKTNLFHRSLSSEIITVAAMIIVLSGLVIVLGTFLVSAFEFSRHPEWRFIDVFFEVVSAFGTVGLSTGLTFDLSTSSKIVLICTMLLGRVGPLTFLFSVSRHINVKRMDHIEENIMIG
ncbi:Trk family potassium uptake protein [bacterium]|nr:Trk family potassium uptake protein [bacterium]